ESRRHQQQSSEVERAERTGDTPIRAATVRERWGCARGIHGHSSGHAGGDSLRARLRRPGGESDFRPEAKRHEQSQKGHERRRPDEMTQRGRPPPEGKRQRKSSRQLQRATHYRVCPHHDCSPCFLAVSIIWEMRSRSFAARLADERSSSAATASSTLPAKNVDTIWRSADLRAISRATVGRYT